MVTAGNSSARALAAHHLPSLPPSVLPFSLLHCISFLFLFSLFLQFLKPPHPLPTLPAPCAPPPPTSLSEVLCCGVDFRSCFPLSLIGLISVLYPSAVCAERAAERTHRPVCRPSCTCVCVRVRVCVFMKLCVSTSVHAHATHCVFLCIPHTGA